MQAAWVAFCAGRLAFCARLAFLVYLLPTAWAGRAFPISTENYVIELFKQINPGIKWDYTNYLVDLSGIYSKCSEVGKKGKIEVDGVHPETQDSIGGLKDYTRGDMKHVRAVNDYLQAGLPAWITDSPFQEQVREAEFFGCSVRPGCSGFVAFSCLFSPAYGGGFRPRPTTPAPTLPPWTPRPTYPPRPTRPPRPSPTPPRPTQDHTGKQVALAFTKQQYDDSEAITGTSWDRSHFLENLSGYDVNCDMMGAYNGQWDFSFAQVEAALLKMKVKGIFGSAPNLGSTPNAMKEILSAWPHIPTRKVGCSVIPDCINRQSSISQMYVVVGCVYEDVNAIFEDNKIDI